jgi:hypothetical protein
MPPDIGEGMGYAAGFFICLGGPAISIAAGLVSAAAQRLMKEFQARDLPLGGHLALGAAVGLGMTLIAAALLNANMCTPPFPC